MDARLSATEDKLYKETFYPSSSQSALHIFTSWNMRSMQLPSESSQYSTQTEETRDSEVTNTLHRGGSLCNVTRIFYASVILLLTIAVPLIIYFTLVSFVEPEIWTCNVKEEYRVPCLKNETQVSQDKCEKSGCCWDEECYHSIPSQHSYSVEKWISKETAVSELETKSLELIPRLKQSPYNTSTVNLLQTRVVSTSQSTLRLYIYDPHTGVPNVNGTISLDSSKFRVEVYGPEYYSVQIYRNETGSLLFSTSLGPTIASDDYWELTFQFPKDAAVFGLGDLRLSSKPKLIYNSGHRLGANPFIMILDTNETAHGILFSNTGPMEFQLLEKSNLLTVQSLSSVMWDISVFAGPTPVDVMEQYTSNDGLRPTMPPPWALGVHICRDTEKYNKTLVAEDALYFLQKADKEKLPYESDCLQEELLYQLDLNLSINLDGVKDEFGKTGRKLLLSLPPHVSSSLANQDDDLFVQSGSARLQEEYHGLNVSYPDFFNDTLKDWFMRHINSLTANIEDILGGFVLQDNWPASNATHNTSEDMHVSEGTLSEGTLWWKVRHGNLLHYQVHNAYGLEHAKVVASSLKANTSLVLSAATYTGIGAVGGSHAHKQAEVTGTWSNMQTALETALGLGLAGIPLAGGGPVCGSRGEYDEELCIRWYQMSSMLPIMRISSEAPLRDPVNLQGGYARNAVKEALELRYSLLAYFYSLFHEASRTGVPVTRPMFFEFPADKQTWTIYEQFMIGPALLACPALYKNALSVSVYLPQENTTWYHFRGGHEVNNGTGGLTVRVTSMSNELVLLLRGGFIVPSQKAESTVDETLAHPYNLVVGLRCDENGGCFATGNFSRDFENYVTFKANETRLQFVGSCSNLFLRDVLVYGLNVTASTNTCTVDIPEGKCTLKEDSHTIEIKDLQLDMCTPGGGEIKWDIGAKGIKTELLAAVND